MRLNFNPNQQYQLDAINAAISVFEGQAASQNEFSLAPESGVHPGSMFANRLDIDEEQILKNVQAIQNKNELEVSPELDGMHFSVEMETGTGKTYVYLRTIYELNQKYGFRKFVIVVPSVAIREGVLKNLSVTHEHLQTLYGKPPVYFSVYDSSRVSELRNFSLSDSIQILVINIDSFAKDENVINRPNDKLTGEKPIDFIKRANPIVIVDEPQNMESDKRKQAIENLNYLCTLRYSATHANRYNLIYSLDPVRAYELGLVKQIEVNSILAENDFNAAYVCLKRINATKRTLSASVEIDCNTRAGVKRKVVKVEPGDDLYQRSNNREIYGSGRYIVNEIDAIEGIIDLSMAGELRIGETIGGMTDERMKLQIRETVAEHFGKEKNLKGKNVKVISLFFIDRVANYRDYGPEGEPVKGKFAQWFEQAFRELSRKKEYKNLIPFNVGEVHDGYFSQDRASRWQDTRGNSKADDDTFRLIMKDKERLLDPNEPLRFIFSHSALREGWDNPNVFQICTLNETQSETKKRQEIGRGMRLAVDSEGNRIQRDMAINRLTVIANESYEDFASQLQSEIEEECGVRFGNRIKDKRERTKVEYREDFRLDKKFKALWRKIKYQTTYRVEYDTQELIKQAAKAVEDMGDVVEPLFRIQRAEIGMAREGVGAMRRRGRASRVKGSAVTMPDVLSYIQNHGRTGLTRSTIYEILSRSGKLGDALKNPQMFMDKAVAAIKGVLSDLMVDGIRYEKVGDREYELHLFEGYEFHKDGHTFKVTKEDKTVNTGWLPLDSNVEKRFARDCEESEDIEFYFKLPSGFKIKTPIGNYNPDWALTRKNGKAVYFIAETKARDQELKTSEERKIEFGKKHCEQLDDVKFRKVTSVEELDMDTD
ncbi:MAG: DEAD/DEAH box helicase family protein [Gammaproteobacteria bacterium]|nr:DEAD/DEAH box helicase family protein [Gammaproteobacteria bacterium]